MNKSNGPDNVKKAAKTQHDKELTKKSYPRGTHPVSLRNLQKWPKGVSGNPAGPPRRKKLLQEAFKEKLNQIIVEEGSQKGQRIAQALADLSWEWVKKAKTVSEFSSLLSQIRECSGERSVQKEDLPPGTTVPFVILLPEKNQAVEIQATVPQIAEAEVIDDSEGN